MPERPTGRAPRLRAGRGLRSLRPRAQKVVETKVQTCDGAAHKSFRLESFAKFGADFIEITKRNLGGSPAKLCPRPSWAPRSTGELDHSACAGWTELASEGSC